MTSSTFVAASGDGYELQMGRWSRRLAEPFIDFAGWRDGESVLDAGCGTGRLALALSNRGSNQHIKGIDVSREYVEYGARQNTNPNVTFDVGDICALPFADASFDRVLSLLVLHFVTEPLRAISELRRVVRPGGTVAAAVWDARGGFVSNRIFWDTAATLDQKGNEARARNMTRPLTRPGELAGAWRAAGLADVRDTTLSIRMEFDSFDDYWTPYAGKDGPVAAYVGSLEPAGRERLREAVRKAYLDGETDGPRSYAAIAWAVAGKVPG